MKHDSHCPRCHAERVRRVFGTRPGERRRPAEPPPFGPAVVTRYECRGCGYAEEWVESRDDLAAIRRLVGDC
jgi:rubredoxin